MADLKITISQLPQAPGVSNESLFAIETNTVTQKATMSQVQAHLEEELNNIIDSRLVGTVIWMLCDKDNVPAGYLPLIHQQSFQDSYGFIDNADNYPYLHQYVRDIVPSSLKYTGSWAEQVASRDSDSVNNNGNVGKFCYAPSPSNSSIYYIELPTVSDHIKAYDTRAYDSSNGRIQDNIGDYIRERSVWMKSGISGYVAWNTEPYAIFAPTIIAPSPFPQVLGATIPSEPLTESGSTQVYQFDTSLATRTSFDYMQRITAAGGTTQLAAEVARDMNYPDVRSVMMLPLMYVGRRVEV